MLDSLEIKNFRNLKELRIKSLGRVNLIIGKNNTGKSTILEALAIYASKGEMSIICDILEERGEYSRGEYSNESTAEKNFEILSSLFTNRKIIFGKEDIISIQGSKNLAEGKNKSTAIFFSIKFTKYSHKEVDRKNEGVYIINDTNNEPIFEESGEVKLPITSYGLVITDGNSSLHLKIGQSSLESNSIFQTVHTKQNFQFIRTNNINREINGKLFDNIALTDKEQYIIDSLKIIEPTIERIAFIAENRIERTAVIKLSSYPKTLPLRSMGDGMNRILTIILAMVNADNGFLLIDEFENGLHYTTQEQLWEIIFSLAQKLNIQVFATTHSEDCIKGFEAILNSSGNADGKLIRLHNDNGVIKEVEFNAEELKIANNRNIELR